MLSITLQKNRIKTLNCDACKKLFDSYSCFIIKTLALSLTISYQQNSEKKKILYNKGCIGVHGGCCTLISVDKVQPRVQQLQQLQHSCYGQSESNISQPENINSVI